MLLHKLLASGAGNTHVQSPNVSEGEVIPDVPNFMLEPAIYSKPAISFDFAAHSSSVLFVMNG